LVPGVRAVCPNPSGGFVAAVGAGPLSWDLCLNGESPALCRVGCSRLPHDAGKCVADGGPVLYCVSVGGRGQRTEGCLRRDSFAALFGGSTESPVLLVGLPDGRVLWTPLRQGWPGGARLLCDLGQPVAALGSWHPDNSGGSAELLVLGQSGLVLARHGQRWLRAWTPRDLGAAEELCMGSSIVQWLHESMPWQARLRLGTTEPPQLLLGCGPLPVGESLQDQHLKPWMPIHFVPSGCSPVSHGTPGLLLLDGAGGLRLVRPPPQPTSHMGSLSLGPLAEARSCLSRSQARLAQLRRMRDQGKSPRVRLCASSAATTTRRLPEGLLVAEFPTLGGVVPGWWHCASFEQGGRTLCRCALPGSAAGQGSVIVPDSGGACALASLALSLPPEVPSGKPLVAVLQRSLLPATPLPNVAPCKAALLSVASAWVPGNASGSGDRLASQLGLGSWPAVLLPAGPGVCILELELPGAQYKPGVRALALLNLLVSHCV
ncbi:unnamed protein product, partial [Ixodes hexagonus]